jgi:hypothetical protein
MPIINNGIFEPEFKIIAQKGLSMSITINQRRPRDPNITIVVINGAQESGKDSMVEFCEKHADATVSNYSIIDPVKDLMHHPLIGWDGRRKNRKDRQLMEALLYTLTDYNDGPFKRTIDRIETDLETTKGRCLAFIHVRNGGNILRFIEHFRNTHANEPYTLHVMNPRPRSFDTDEDRNTGTYQYDINISNDGTLEALEEAAITFLDFLGIPTKTHGPAAADDARPQSDEAEKGTA